jgi:hypothetical protein
MDVFCKVGMESVLLVIVILGLFVAQWVMMWTMQFCWYLEHCHIPQDQPLRNNNINNVDLIYAARILRFYIYLNRFLCAATHEESSPKAQIAA